MQEEIHNIFKQLKPSVHIDDYKNNVEILKKTEYFIKLCNDLHYKNIEELFKSSENIPRNMELFIIIDFEKKRSLICDLLLSIHNTYPKNFTLDNYLHSTKKIFGIITQYRWSGENISFVIKIIFIYLRMHLHGIGMGDIIQTIDRFQNYGPWTKEDFDMFMNDHVGLELIDKIEQSDSI